MSWPVKGGPGHRHDHPSGYRAGRLQPRCAAAERPQAVRRGSALGRRPPQPRQAASPVRSAYSRTQACIAIAAAAEALIERVEPNCAIEKVPSHASRAPLGQARDPPGRTGSRPAAARPSSPGAPSRAGCRCRAGATLALVEVRRQVGDRRVVAHVLVAVGDHRAAPVPAPVADDVHLGGEERVGGAHDRADVEVVLPVLDRDVEVVPAGVEVGDDRLHRPVAVAVDHVAPVTVARAARASYWSPSGHGPAHGPTPTSAGPCGIGSYGARSSSVP